MCVVLFTFRLQDPPMSSTVRGALLYEVRSCFLSLLLFLFPLKMVTLLNDVALPTCLYSNTHSSPSPFRMNAGVGRIIRTDVGKLLELL